MFALSNQDLKKSRTLVLFRTTHISSLDPTKFIATCSMLSMIVVFSNSRRRFMNVKSSGHAISFIKSGSTSEVRLMKIQESS